jgi:hypothetical protein
MKAHEGLLALALLLIAVAAGCEKDKGDSTPKEASIRSAQEPASSPALPRASVDPAASQDRAPDAATQPPPRPQDVPATEELAKARQELADLAQGAISLRAALLGAEFKNVQAARDVQDRPGPEEPQGETP